FVSPVEARVHLGLAYGDLAREEAAYFDRPQSLLRDFGVAIRAVAARCLATSRSVPEGRPFVVAAHLDPVTVDESVMLITETHDSPRSRLVFFVHPHALNLAAFDSDHAARLAGADVVLPDGIGLRVGAALLGTPLPHNVNGTDIVPLLANALA